MNTTPNYKPGRYTLVGFLGPTLDAGAGEKRWERWRPSVAACQQPDLLIDRYEMFIQQKFAKLAHQIASDIQAVSPETEVRMHELPIDDPWDFEQVYAALHDWSQQYEFDSETDYLVNITTGTHVAQICLFLLTESRHLPSELLQLSPSSLGINTKQKKKRGKEKDDELSNPAAGVYQVIDLDLSRYDQLAGRFEQEQREATSILKSGIETRSQSFNGMIAMIERVAIRSHDPVLLAGPTGAGKSLLANRIYELKQHQKQIDGPLIEVNCATLRGDGAMSALFGHTKGAFTGAEQAREGLLRAADKGILFLDEIGELGLDEQAMLLRAIEEHTFMPVGSDAMVQSDFQLIAATNRDLACEVAEGRFREDLLARINLWTFQLPGLAERSEDIEPNLEYELAKYTQTTGRKIIFKQNARKSFLDFATSKRALWLANFRDLSAATTRMATLASNGRIDVDEVEEEIKRLEQTWGGCSSDKGDAGDDFLADYLDAGQLAKIDHFDRIQLTAVIRICLKSQTLAEAGRVLFDISRLGRKTPNDTDRIRKYLTRFNLTWEQLR